MVETDSNMNNMKEFRVIILGLDNSGKTTLLYQLKMGEVVNCIPTLGFNVETIEIYNKKLTIWDIGGQERIRTLWKHYYDNTQGIIFVVDSSNKESLATAREELKAIFNHENLKKIPLLIFSNKKDKEGSLMDGEVSELLATKDIKDRAFCIKPSNALNGDSLKDGIKWLCEELDKKL